MKRRTRTYAIRPAARRMPLASVLVVLCCAVATSGCRLPGFSKPSQPVADPFANRSPVAANDSGVQPASFDAPPTPTEPPGVSLPNSEPEQEPSWLDHFSVLEPANMVTSMKKAVGLGIDEKVARESYAEADTLFREKNYADAANLYKKAARRFPDSILEEDAMFMRAESLFFADNYSKASDVYANLCKKYENSRYLDKVTARQFSIARYWEERGKTTYTLAPNLFDKKRPLFDTGGNAVAVYESIRLNDPTGPLADDAVMATATHHFLDNNFEDADYYYGLLRTEYPRSEHQPKAHLVGIEAKLRSYQGAQYAEAPLMQADKLIDTTLAQFGQEFPEERRRLLEAKNGIRTQKAEREWVSGEYYYRRKQYRAAKIHYNRLIEEYPETELAAKAHERIAEVKDLPPTPPNNFAWLGWIFGENGKTPRRR